MSRPPGTIYVPIHMFLYICSYTYVPLRWEGNKLALCEGLFDTQVLRSGLGLVEQHCVAKSGRRLRNLQRSKRVPVVQALFTDLRDEIEGSKLGIAHSPSPLGL